MRRRYPPSNNDLNHATATNQHYMATWCTSSDDETYRPTDDDDTETSTSTSWSVEEEEKELGTDPSSEEESSTSEN